MLSRVFSWRDVLQQLDDYIDAHITEHGSIPPVVITDRKTLSAIKARLLQESSVQETGLLCGKRGMKYRDIEVVLDGP